MGRIAPSSYLLPLLGGCFKKSPRRPKDTKEQRIFLAFPTLESTWCLCVLVVYCLPRLFRQSPLRGRGIKIKGYSGRRSRSEYPFQRIPPPPRPPSAHMLANLTLIIACVIMHTCANEPYVHGAYGEKASFLVPSLAGRWPCRPRADRACLVLVEGRS